MNNRKNITILTAMTLVLTLAISASFAVAAEQRSVYGDLYIDDVLAPEGIEVKLTFETVEKNDTTNSQSAYTINIVVDNYIDGDFTVYYNGVWYIPTDNQTVEIGGTGEIDYHIDLHINTSDAEAPSNVTGLTVTDKKDGKLDLSWTAATDNVAVDHYNIYRDDSYIDNTTGTTYSDSGLTNGQQYKYEVEAVDTSDNVGPLSDPAYGTPTASSSGGGGGGGGSGGGGGGGFPPVDTNQAPTALIIASETSVFIGDSITFDGTGSSDPDGNIFNWSWDFGDGNGDFDNVTTHSYDQEGDFTVTLTVKDNQGKLATDTETISVAKANNPPTVPTIEGPASGTKGSDYTFTFTSTDADNDTIKYIITNWGDGETEESAFVANGTSVDFVHSYTNAGKYTIVARAFDNDTQSGSAEHVIYIDAHEVGDIGYLTNDDTDDPYDNFHSNSGAKTPVEQQTDGKYLIDEDDDDNWDWVYDLETDTLTEYSGEEQGMDYTPIIIIIIVIIVVLIILGYLMKRNNDKKKQAKKKEEQKKQNKPKKKGKK
jgi:chitodextrinase